LSERFDTVIDRRNSGCFRYDALNMIYGRSDLLSLWVADMDFAVSDEIQQALAKRAQHPVYGYNLRLPDFYQAVIQWQQKRFGWNTKEDWILAVPGIVPGLSLTVLSLTEPGDGVLILSPVYTPFYNAATDHGRMLLTSSLISAEGVYSIDWDDFEAKLKQSKLFILCTPHNPVGRVWSEEELCKIGHLCLKHKVTVFSDEIHEDLIFTGNKHIPFASLENFAEITITGISPAKSFNIAGLATAVLMISNPNLRNPVKELSEKLHLFMGNSFGIVALIAAYKDSEAWLEELLGYLHGNRKLIIDYVDKELTGVQVSPIEGTYLAWLDFREWNLTAKELQDTMVNKALLALDPGIRFGIEGSGFMRLNFGCPRSILQEALTRIKALSGSI
jgi:cystathionine beta-lyase